MKKTVMRNTDVLPYIIFGILTTLVNIISYWVLAHPLGIDTLPSTVIAWVLSVLFAYGTNRTWVFHSTAKTGQAILREMISFFACRITTGLVDWLGMYLFVEICHWDDMIVKIALNVLVIVLNYIASKWLIFRK